MVDIKGSKYFYGPHTPLSYYNPPIMLLLSCYSSPISLLAISIVCYRTRSISYFYAQSADAFTSGRHAFPFDLLVDSPGLRLDLPLRRKLIGITQTLQSRFGGHMWVTLRF